MYQFFSRFIFTYILLAGAFFSCGGDANIVEESNHGIDSTSFWADSIFGNLTNEQAYNQHLIFEIPAHYQQAIDSFAGWVLEQQPGGLHFLNWDTDSVQRLKNILDTHQLVQPFFYGDYTDLTQTITYPWWEANKDARDLSFTQFFSEAGYQLLNFNQSITPDKFNRAWLDSIYLKQGITPVVQNFHDQNTQDDFDDFLHSLSWCNHAIELTLQQYDSISLNNYRKSHAYAGIFIVRAKEQMINYLLGNGTDLVYKRLESPETFSNWNPSSDEQIIFDESTKRILKRKAQRPEYRKPVNSKEELNYVRLNFQAKSTALLRNDSKLIPFKSKFTLYADSKTELSQKTRTECGVTVVNKKVDIQNLNEIITAKGSKVIMLDDTCSDELLAEINKIKTEKNTLVAFSNPTHFEKLSTCPNLIFYPGLKDFSLGIFIQQITSRLTLNGDFYLPDTLVKGLRAEKKLLARTDPNFVGLDADTLAYISGMMSNCMSNHAFPGGQVLIAKNGCIVYDKVFGKHTYQGQTLVTENSMYDLASITKVVSTTMVGMKLYEMGMYELDDSLATYLPDSLRLHLKFPSTIRNLTFQELFTHCSGMPAGFPILKYMKYTTPDYGRYDKYYCDRPDSVYNTEVAEGFYLEREQQDSMWLKLNQIYLNPDKSYHYSDVNMNTLYFIFKSIIQKDPSKFGFNQPKKQLKDKNLFEEFLYNTFYKPLGMNHTMYRPLKKYSRDIIVPTENDTWWRKQLLHGYVHDPNAALHGGVAGNAGIFSTANDLVILFQMLLNKGVYNGQRYLKAETVEKFTSRQENCFRGLGFNKPSMGSVSFGMSPNASLSTYGHTGFTGTCFWIDPEHELIYIYLSNAVHPTVNNKTYEYGIRKRVHQCAYDAMMGEEY